MQRQRRKRARVEAQLERNLERSDIEELSGNEFEDPDFRDDAPSVDIEDQRERDRRNEDLENQVKARKELEDLPLEAINPQLRRAILVRRALGGY